MHLHNYSRTGLLLLGCFDRTILYAQLDNYSESTSIRYNLANHQLLRLISRNRFLAQLIDDFECQ